MGFLNWMKRRSASQTHSAGPQSAHRAEILSYRAPKDMSTRKVNAAIFALLFAIFLAPKLYASDPLPANALKDSPSLYLREAADSPVRWQPFDAATFALARKLKRPMLIDIGAVWCHWCHVMDEKTYADAKVAATINREFVPVKVDSDQRPDIDGYYQLAAQNFSAGGWPLTCFATPDGAPILIAGYLPPTAQEHQGMLWVLDHVSDAYARDPKLDHLAHEIAAKVAAPENATGGKPGSDDEIRSAIVKATQSAFEAQAHGQGEGASFYDFPATQLLLAHGFFGRPEFTADAIARLKAIAAGGVYDQLGGGFHRYSTDPNWRVPHFEKLAYDQAMALKTYAQAYEVTHDQEFTVIDRSIIEYIEETLFDDSTHCFYSHQDADAFAGDDGSYYTWSEDELRRVLKGSELEVALLYFGFADPLDRAPDGRVVLREAMTIGDVAGKLKMPPPEAAGAVERVKYKMLAARRQRRAPQVDNMVLIDRNALMDSAYLAAAAALADRQIEHLALENLDFLYANARAQDGSFYHVLNEGKPEVAGLAADQVYMMSAMLDAYQASGDRKYLDDARALAAMIFGDFRDPATGLLKSRAPATPGTVLGQASATPQVLYDDPTPAIQAVAAESFRTLAALTGDASFASKAGQLLKPAADRIGPFAGPNNGELGLALEDNAGGQTVVAVVGPDDAPETKALWHSALATYRPGKVVMRISADNKVRLPEAMKAMYEAAAHGDAPLAFVCAGTACAKPSADAAALARTIRDFAVNRAGSGNFASR